MKQQAMKGREEKQKWEALVGEKEEKISQEIQKGTEVLSLFFHFLMPLFTVLVAFSTITEGTRESKASATTREGSS